MNMIKVIFGFLLFSASVGCFGEISVTASRKYVDERTELKPVKDASHNVIGYNLGIQTNITLISNIKTVNGNSLLGPGNIEIQGGGGGGGASDRITNATSIIKASGEWLTKTNATLWATNYLCTVANAQAKADAAQAAAIADAAENYLPLAGGTMTGDIYFNGRFADFSEGSHGFTIWNRHITVYGTEPDTNYYFDDGSQALGEDQVVASREWVTNSTALPEAFPIITNAYTRAAADARYAPTSTAVTVASHATQLSQLSQSIAAKIDAQAVTGIVAAATNALPMPTSVWSDANARSAACTNRADSFGNLYKGTTRTGGLWTLGGNTYDYVYLQYGAYKWYYYPRPGYTCDVCYYPENGLVWSNGGTAGYAAAGLNPLNGDDIVITNVVDQSRAGTFTPQDSPTFSPTPYDRFARASELPAAVASAAITNAGAVAAAAASAAATYLPLDGGVLTGPLYLCDESTTPYRKFDVRASGDFYAGYSPGWDKLQGTLYCNTAELKDYYDTESRYWTGLQIRPWGFIYLDGTHTVGGKREHYIYFPLTKGSNESFTLAKRDDVASPAITNAGAVAAAAASAAATYLPKSGGTVTESLEVPELYIGEDLYLYYSGSLEISDASTGMASWLTPDNSEVMTENKAKRMADYALTDGAVLKSGEIAAIETATNLTVRLDFAANGRGADCGAYVENTAASNVTLAVAGGFHVACAGDEPLTLPKASTNLVWFCRVKTNVVVVSRQEVK